MEEQKTYELAEGCMWEGGSWKIVLDYECSRLDGGKPCRHCKDHRQIRIGRYDKKDTQIWTCPRVVVAVNDDGCSSTGVCLDCILEAVRTLNVANKLRSIKGWNELQLPILPQ